MEKKIKILLAISVLVIVLSLAGFYNSYLSHFPYAGDFKWIIHVHFFAFTCWFVLIIVQPILIRRRRYELHKKIGRFCHFLIPLLVITIIALRAERLEEEVKVSLPNASMNAFVTFVDVLSLCCYYLIAVLNSKNLRWHVAFIMATTLVVFNPGLARLLNILVEPGAGMLTVLVPFIFTVTVFLVEKFKLKRPILKSPYFTFFLLWTFEVLMLFIIPQTKLWQNLIFSISN